jgi:arginase
MIVVPFHLGEPRSGLEAPRPASVLSPELPDASPQQRIGVLYSELANRAAGEEMPIAYGWDCIAALGVVAGLQRRGVHPTVVWLDAHGDFHTWETTGSGYMGGMALAMLVGRGEQTIARAVGLETVPESAVLLSDARDLDPGEREAVAASEVRVVPVTELAALLPPGPIHVHIDVDVVDASEMPALLAPAGSGPSLEKTCEALAAIAATGRVAGLSVCCAWHAEDPASARTQRATWALMEPFLHPDAERAAAPA